MTQYVGVDIIEIERIEKAVSRWGERFLRRIYTASEIAAYRNRPASLAARFACKEAVMKLLGTGNPAWRQIETLSLPNGRPFVKLTGQAKAQAELLGVKEIAVSLSHSREYAIAYVSGISASEPGK